VTPPNSQVNMHRRKQTETKGLRIMGHTALEVPRPMMAGMRTKRMADPVTSIEPRMATKWNTGPQARTRLRPCARTTTMPTRTRPETGWVMMKALMSSWMPSDPRHRKVLGSGHHGIRDKEGVDTHLRARQNWFIFVTSIPLRCSCAFTERFPHIV